MEFPKAWLEAMERLLGGEYGAFLQAMGEAPAQALRLNALREGAGSDRAGERVPWSPFGRYLRPGDTVRTGGDIAHAAGVYYMQEASAQAPAEVLAARPGEVVLDLCAAPGGKATQLAGMMRGRGALVANEITFTRARALSGNLERMGVRNAAVVSEAPDRLSEKWPETFGAVLVDAPCSGEGMFRRDYDARAAWTPGAPAGCSARQLKILDSAARMVKPGGRICYSTCTFNELENEGVVRGFLAAHPEFGPREFELEGVGRSEGGMLRLWPHRLRGDGHFVALLIRRGERAPAEVRERVRISDKQIAKTPGRWAEALEGFVLLAREGMQDVVPPEMPDLSGLRVLRPGLRLGEWYKYSEPHHALAMAFAPECFDRAVSLNEGEARAYLAGEALMMDAPNGWTHVSHRGWPLGWGKMAQGTLKNHLPKGLRLR